MNTPPKKWKMALLIWIFIYPCITALSLLLHPVIKDWPSYVRTLPLTLVLVPLMVFAALPFINKNFAVWIRK